MDIKNINSPIPSTRYQGSKRRILPWIHEHIHDLTFNSVLDGFGGTSSVSYLLKLMGKKVTFNDILLSNYQIGLSLIENSGIILTEIDVKFILNDNGFKYPNFISEVFSGIYYTKKENEWLDKVIFNIERLDSNYRTKALKYKRALAYDALFQSCLTKRPFNLFHRKNLNLRTRKVSRQFGNKGTWEKSFPFLFKQFAHEISSSVFDNSHNNKAIQTDLLNLKENKFDLVYLDPPYSRPKDFRPKNYYNMYHFLEGILDYNNWNTRIDWTTKNLRLLPENNDWDNNYQASNLESLFEKFKNSTIVLSYGSPGKPSTECIIEILSAFKSDITVYKKRYTYKLNRRNGTGLFEVLIVGK